MTMTSGQLPVNAQDGTMSDDIAVQTRQSLENVKAIVEAAGLQVKNIVILRPHRRQDQCVRDATVAPLGQDAQLVDVCRGPMPGLKALRFW